MVGVDFADGGKLPTAAGDWQEEFDTNGYVVVRGAIAPDLVETARREADQLTSRWANGELADQKEVRLLVRSNNTCLDGIQGLHRLGTAFAAIRRDPAIRRLLKQRLGEHLASVVDTLFLKPPGQHGTGIAYHRDAQFRQPPEHFRDLERNYVQVGVALERHGAANGGIVMVPGSHLMRDVDVVQNGSVRGVDDLDCTWSANDAMRSPVAVEAEAGDLILWGAYTVHGSPPNRSPMASRKFYVVGYMAAHACDAGYPV